MGGGSSQVAFVPPAASKPPAACTTPSQPVSFKGRPLPLYTTSHLEYGLKKSKAVALAAFESTNNLTGNPCFHAGALDVGVPFETRSVQVVGTGNFDGCVAALQSRLQPAVSPCECELCTYGRVAQPPAGPSEYVAFAFYAERTTDIGMASPLTLADIRAKGSEVCAMGIEEVRQAYPEGTVKNGVATDLCYDMAFIYTHLAVGHGLHNAPGTRISVVHKINGYVWGGGGRGVVVQCGIEWAREGSVKTAVLWPVAAPGWSATHGVVRPRLWRRARMGHPPRSPHLHVVSVHSHLVQRTDLAWSSPPPLFVGPRGLLVTRCTPPFCFPRLNGGRVLGTMSPPPPAPGPRRTAWSSAGVWAPCLPSSAASRSCRATLFLFFRPLAAAPPTKNARARRRPYSPPAFPPPLPDLFPVVHVVRSRQAGTLSHSSRSWRRVPPHSGSALDRGWCRHPAPPPPHHRALTGSTCRRGDGARFARPSQRRLHPSQTWAPYRHVAGRYPPSRRPCGPPPARGGRPPRGWAPAGGRPHPLGRAAAARPADGRPTDAAAAVPSFEF